MNDLGLVSSSVALRCETLKYNSGVILGKLNKKLDVLVYDKKTPL